MAVSAPQTLPPGTATSPWDQIVHPVRPFLDRVTQRLAAQVDAFEPEIADYTRYALANQGKQLRPALVALAGEAVGGVNEDLVTVAVIIEMVHLATLVHDDIMDGATLRRGRPTHGNRWGSEISVLVGDCLFAHALALASNFPTTDVCRAVATATRRVCTGEILQTHRRRRWGMPRSEYFRVLELKTAELFALACELGGRLAGGDPTRAGHLRAYGMALGTAYQIYDDCLDLYGSEEEAGKSLGTDLASGKVTLPLLIFLERARPDERSQMIGWLERWDPGYFVGVRSMLEHHHALTESGRVIDDYLAGARRSVAALPTTPGTESLARLTHFLAQQVAGLGV